MRYKSIELVNYAGIYNGMGLNQIKIDFTNCISNKIIIRGSNGSGKSTLMNAININPDSNDKFISGLEARKTLVLLDGECEYIIRYIHPITNTGRGTTKGYISKNINGQYIELNPNGNISSCKEILYDEFGFDSSFISLSQLSSEDRGLVDKKPAERKKLVSSITNSMDTFNAIYKFMSKKITSLKSIINNISAKIDMIGDENKLRISIDSISSRLEKLESEKNMIIETIAGIKLKISNINNTLDQNNYNDIVNELNSLISVNKSYENEINNVLRNYKIESIDKLKGFLDYINHSIIDLEYSIKSLKDSIPIKLNERNEEFKELQNKQEKLKSLEGDINFLELKKLINDIEIKLNEYDNIFHLMGLMNIDLITKDEFESGMDILNTLLNNANVLTSTYEMEYIKDDIYNRDKILELINSLQSNKLELQRLIDQKSKLDAEFILVQSKRELAKELLNRPKECQINDCVYIANAYNANIEFPEERLVSLSNQINDIDNAIKDLNIIINRSNIALDIRRYIGNIERDLNSKLLNKLPLRKDFRETFLSRVVELDPFKDITDLYEFIDCGNMIEEYKLLSKQLELYKSEYKIYESKNDIIESILSDINTLQSKTDKLSLEIDQNNALILDKEKSLLELNDVKSILDSILNKYESEYIPNKNRITELSDVKSILDSDAQKLPDLNNNLITLQNEFNNVNNTIKELSNQLQALNHSLIMINEYKIELNQYNHEYQLISKLRYYASPNTGIQSIFIGIFMNKILSNANQLLGLLFNGEFVLEPFIVNESEFRIPAIGSGLRHDDISSMSTAQKSAIALIISFALLNQSSTKYNIICLDEMDGGMDTINRSNFILLLDRIMNMLHCEQAFIISHNNELDTSLCDIIALKNYSSEIINGNIIWKY